MLLIIDKDEVVRRLCGAVLACSGYPVLLAADVSEGLDICRRFSSKLRLAILGESMKSSLCDDLRKIVPLLRCLSITRQSPAELLQRVSTLYGTDPAVAPLDLNSGDTFSETLRTRLAAIPSIFGRLSYLANCRPLADAKLRHLMRDIHRRTFERWLALGMHAQQADYETYLRSDLVITLPEPDVEDLVPEQMLDVQRRLFVADIQMLKRLSRP